MREPSIQLFLQYRLYGLKIPSAKSETELCAPFLSYNCSLTTSKNCKWRNLQFEVLLRENGSSVYLSNYALRPEDALPHSKFAKSFKSNEVNHKETTSVVERGLVFFFIAPSYERWVEVAF